LTARAQQQESVEILPPTLMASSLEFLLHQAVPFKPSQIHVSVKITRTASMGKKTETLAENKIRGDEFDITSGKADIGTKDDAENGRDANEPVFLVSLRAISSVPSPATNLSVRIDLIEGHTNTCYNDDRTYG
jgi:hypothetical protein